MNVGHRRILFIICGGYDPCFNERIVQQPTLNMTPSESLPTVETFAADRAAADPIVEPGIDTGTVAQEPTAQLLFSGTLRPLQPWGTLQSS